MPLNALRDRLQAADATSGPHLADVRKLNRILWHVPEDMTVKVESGVKLTDLQARLAAAGQWLPLDPWDAKVTIKRVIDENLHGPRRFGFGTVRDHLIGMEILLADGRLVTSGGNVVKNVAGYDLMKLFVGARQSLGVVVSATFKLWPLPRREVFLQRECADAAEAGDVTAKLLESAVCPTVLDWHGAKNVTVVIAFAGEDADVGWQLGRVADFGFAEIAEPRHDAAFFRACTGDPGRRSVLPSRLCEAVAELRGAPFLARAGNGTIWSVAIETAAGGDAAGLESRLKKLFDPLGVLPGLP